MLLLVMNIYIIKVSTGIDHIREIYLLVYITEQPVTEESSNREQTTMQVENKQKINVFIIIGLKGTLHVTTRIKRMR